MLATASKHDNSLQSDCRAGMLVLWPGRNCRYVGHRLSVSLSTPFTPKHFGVILEGFRVSQLREYDSAKAPPFQSTFSRKVRQISEYRGT